MSYQKWLLASAIAAIAGGGIATSVLANQSDVSGVNTINSPGNWSISSTGSDSITVTSTVGDTGINFAGLPEGLNLPPGIMDLIAGAFTDPDIKTAMGTRRATGLDDNAQAESITLTFNDIAELINGNLNQALAQLARAEAAAKDSSISSTRRIVRDSAVASAVCGASTFALAEARQTVQDRLEDSRMFIEQMRLISPNRNIW